MASASFVKAAVSSLLLNPAETARDRRPAVFPPSVVTIVQGVVVFGVCFCFFVCFLLFVLNSPPVARLETRPVTNSGATGASWSELERAGVWQDPGSS